MHDTHDLFFKDPNFENRFPPGNCKIHTEDACKKKWNVANDTPENAFALLLNRDRKIINGDRKEKTKTRTEKLNRNDDISLSGAESFQNKKKKKTPRKSRATAFFSPPETQIYHICSRGFP